jgi:sugar lactone lactonase YvrE
MTGAWKMNVKKVIWLIIVALASACVYKLVLAFIPPDFEIPVGYMAEQVLAPLISKPLAIAVNSSGDILLTGHDEGEVFQLHEDGSVTGSQYTVGTYHAAMDFDAEDNLYVVSESGLWKVAPNGTANLVAPGVSAYQLAISPSGDIFSTDAQTTDVLRITPEGQVSVYATGMSGASDVDVNPITGEVYVADWYTGDILRANPDGTTTVVSAGPPINHYIAFSPDGQLYMAQAGALAQVSIVDGTRTFLPWTVGGQGDNCGLTISLIEFDHQGNVISADYTLGDIARLDLDAETMEILVQGIVNPRALAVAPNGGGVYLGIASLLCSRPGKILHIEEDGNPSVIVDDLPPSVDSIAFDNEGMGFVSSGDQIYTFTSGGVTNTLIAEHIGSQALAVHPDTNVLWGAGNSFIWHLDDAGELVMIPYPFEQAHESPRLAFTPDGTLYIYACEKNGLDPAQPGIYWFDLADSSFTLILDLTGQHESACGVGSITGAKDGNLYWLISDLLRITPSGEATVFAVIPGGDPNSIVADPDDTDLYFGNAAGVYRIFEANTIFLPLVVRD